MLIYFLKNKKGLAAVEFALVLPILIALLFGSISAFDIYNADRAISRAVDSVAEIVSRQDGVDDQLRNDLFSTGQALLGRYFDSATYGVTLTHIGNDGTNDFVLWSEANANGRVLTDADLASITIPDIPEAASIVYVEIENTYEPIFKMPIRFFRAKSRRPRFVSSIAYID